MTVDFEVFEAGPVVQNTDRPHVTISKLGHIFLNRHALALLGDPIAVTLMYDRKRKIIGVILYALGMLIGGGLLPAESGKYTFFQSPRYIPKKNIPYRHTMNKTPLPTRPS